MVVLNINMPENCITCPLMRCGMCIAKDSMKVTDDDYDVLRHPDCPLMDFSEMFDVLCELSGCPCKEDKDANNT